MANTKLVNSSNESKQVRSRQRVEDHGEVFTNESEVNAMLDLVAQEAERIDSTFLEPACGNGNFLAEVLRRKLETVTRKYAKSQTEWEMYMLVAVSSLYGVDILEDNAEECRERLYKMVLERYQKHFGTDCKPECLRSARYLLKRNILWGDALDYTNPHTKEPIIFSEWKVVTDKKFQRKDFMFKFLVDKTYQYSMFNDEGEVASIDEPVKEYPPISMFSLGEEVAE